MTGCLTYQAPAKLSLHFSIHHSSFFPARNVYAWNLVYSHSLISNNFTSQRTIDVNI